MMSDRTDGPHEHKVGLLRRSNPPGRRCGQLAMANGRCRYHGGLSTGPRTKEGMRRLRVAVTKHGNRTAAAREFRALVRELQKQARRICEAV